MTSERNHLGVDPPTITVSRPTSELFMSAPPKRTITHHEHEINTPQSLQSSKTWTTLHQSSTTSTRTLSLPPSEDHRDDEKERTEKSKKWEVIKHNISAWSLELVWAFISITLLMGLVMVLSHFNGKTLPDLPLGLTLNTIIAVLATLCRATTVFLVSQGIGQLKWNLFADKKRPVKDLGVFDDASRGPWGGLIMIGRTRGNILAVLASLLVITSLASSTLTQSAISYVPQLVPAHNLTATARSCKEYPCGGPLARYSAEKAFDSTKFISRLESAGFGAVFSAMDAKPQTLEPACQSADCKWPTFNSLGVCVQTRNITDKLEIKTENDEEDEDTVIYTASLPLLNATFIEKVDLRDPRWGNEGLNVTTVVFDFDAKYDMDGLASITWPYPRESLAFKDDKDALLAGLTSIVLIHNMVKRTNKTPEKRYRASEVLLHFCVQEMEVKVDQGTSSTRMVKSHTEVTDRDEGSVSITGEGNSSSFTISSADGKESFKFTSSGQPTQLGTNFDRAFRGYYSDWMDKPQVFQKDIAGEVMRHVGINMFHDLDPEMSVEETDAKTWQNLNKMMDVIGSSMSNSMREVGAEVEGTAYTSVTFIKIRWEWLSLVAAQVGLSIVFMLAVMVGTARCGVDVVKSSNMAELFAVRRGYEVMGHSRDSLAPDLIATGGSISTKVEKGVEGRLVKDELGWRLVVDQKGTEA